MIQIGHFARLKASPAMLFIMISMMILIKLIIMTMRIPMTTFIMIPIPMTQLDGEVQNLVRRRRSPTSLTGGGISFGSGFSLGSGLGLAGWNNNRKQEFTELDLPPQVLEQHSMLPQQICLLDWAWLLSRGKDQLRTAWWDGHFLLLSENELCLLFVMNF